MPIRASRKRLREQRAVGERADLAARGHPPDFSGRSQPEVDVAVGIDGQAFWELEGGRVEIDDLGDVFGKTGIAIIAPANATTTTRIDNNFLISVSFPIAL
ncbi:MAG: hypothetical protein QGH54_14570 [SAR202 cluster bacterium]|jgi:hypothetical protein|nr:hypothetical protein [SAR202 cluster bacterium]